MVEPATNSGSDDVVELARRVVAALRAAGSTVATAESLTGGLVGAALTGVAGASAVYRGGVVSYATELKHQLLGVDADLLRLRGAVDPAVAAAMAFGVRERLGADYGVATTGVAGPDPQDGKAVGTVWVAVASSSESTPLDVSVALPPGADVRDRVRRAAVLGALRHLEHTLAATDGPAEARGAPER